MHWMERYIGLPSDPTGHGPASSHCGGFVRIGPFNTVLIPAEYDAINVDDVLNEPLPGYAYVPGEYPGLH